MPEAESETPADVARRALARASESIAPRLEALRVGAAQIPIVAPFFQRLDADLIQPVGDIFSLPESNPRDSLATTSARWLAYGAQVLASGAGIVESLTELPQAMYDTATAAASNFLLPPGAGLPPIGLGGLHIGPPHAHAHPPSLVPPAPPIPLPSLGTFIGPGCLSVRAAGLPVGRAEDIGYAITCGSFGAMFEAVTGSSSVYADGKRVARALDITRHCNPMPAGESPGAVNAFMEVVGVVGEVAPIVQSTLEAVRDGLASREADEPAQAQALALSAAGHAANAALSAAQLAADNVVEGLKAGLCGTDPGAPPGMGMLVPTGAFTVMVGGLPTPPWSVAFPDSDTPDSAPPAQRRHSEHDSDTPHQRHSQHEEGRQSTHEDEVPAAAPERHPDSNAQLDECGDPVDATTGHVVASVIELDLEGLAWGRHASTALRHSIGPLGRSNRSTLQLELEVRLDRCIVTTPKGTAVVLPAFRGRSTVTRFGISVRRSSLRSHTITYDAATWHFDDERLTERRDTTTLRSFAYDADGRLARIIHRAVGDGAHLAETLFTHDAQGLLRRVEHHGGTTGTVEYGYDECSRLNVSRDARGFDCHVEFDTEHRPTRLVPCEGPVVMWRYDSEGRCFETAASDGTYACAFEYKRSETRVTDARGTRRLHIDPLGTLSRIDFPDGTALERGRDPQGRTVFEQDSRGRRVDWLYDASGAHIARLTARGDLLPKGTLDSRLGVPDSALPMDAAGQRGLRIGPADLAPIRANAGPSGISEWLSALVRTPQSSILRDPIGDAIERTDEHGTIRAHRDRAGRMTTFTDRDGRTFRFELGTLGPIAVTDANGHSLRAEVDTLGQVVRFRDAGGTVTEYRYDRGGRITEALRNGTLAVGYDYTPTGIIARLRGPVGERATFDEYDGETPGLIQLASGETIRQRKTQHCVQGSFGRRTVHWKAPHTFSQTRDPSGVLVEDLVDGLGVSRLPGNDDHVRVVVGRFRIHTRRDAGRVVVRDPTGSRHRFEVVGALARRDAPWGTTELLALRSDGHIVGRALSHEGTIVRQDEFQRDGEGNLLRTCDRLTGNEQGFMLDAAGRLVGEIDATGVHPLPLDPAGNLLSSRFARSALYGSGNRLVSTDRESFEHDTLGRIARRTGSTGTTEYRYDSLSRLIEVVLPDGTAWTAQHDPTNRAVWAGERRFLWEGDRVAAELTPGLFRIHLYLDEALTPFGFVDYDSIDASPESGRVHHVFHDPTGMPERIENSTGQVVWKASRIDAYGWLDIDPSSTIDYRLRWPGHIFVPETGLHLNRHRDYDPRLGRYLQPDPIGIGGGPNVYAYSDHPRQRVDLLGLHTRCEALAEAAAILGGPIPQELSDFIHLVYRRCNEDMAAPGADHDRLGKQRDAAIHAVLDALARADVSPSTRPLDVRATQSEPRAPERAAYLEEAQRAMFERAAAPRTAVERKAIREHLRKFEPARRRAWAARELSDTNLGLAGAEGRSPQQVVARARTVMALGGSGFDLTGIELTRPINVGVTGDDTVWKRMGPDTPNPESESPGRWAVPDEAEFTADERGVSRRGQGKDDPNSSTKVERYYRVDRGVLYVESVNAPIHDDFSRSTVHGKPPVYTGGGGVQIMSSNRRWSTGYIEQRPIQE